MIIQRNILGEIYTVKVLSGETGLFELAYENIIVPFQADSELLLIVPGLSVTFQADGETTIHSFPLPLNLFAADQIGTLKIKPVATLSYGMHTFFFYCAQPRVPAYGMSYYNDGGFGDFPYRLARLRLPMVQYFITTISDSVEILERTYVRGLIT